MKIKLLADFQICISVPLNAELVSNHTVIIWKSVPARMNALFEWAPLFTAEKFNDHPNVNEYPPQIRKF